MRAQAVGACHAARHVVVGAAAHEEQVGGRQHGDGHAGAGQSLRDLDLPLGRDGGELGGMADGDAAAVAVGVGRAAHLVEVHPAGIEIEVEVEVDVEVEAAGDGEDARDVLVRVRVGVGAAADQVGALGAGRHQQLLGARVVDQPLLREDADLQVERPGVIALQLRDGAEAPSGRCADRPRRGCACAWCR